VSERPLSGGRITPGVVQIGDTVRRPAPLRSQFVVKLLRAFHDATRGSRLAGDHEVVCHHDPGPNNTIFRSELPAALIDFDMAEPGGPLEDLGYAAWTWCVASKRPLETQPARVKVLVDAYGLTGPERGAVVDAILDRQLRNARFWTETTVGVADDQRAERIAWSYREHAFTTTNREVFERALA
jgi:aminoglycoside phosphotransferase (APT) family kinase protein